MNRYDEAVHFKATSLCPLIRAESMTEPILQNLTDAQREAASHIDGPMLMLAGPGSGKTRVVTHRIAYLLQQGIPAHQIAALTFTNKAADEMRSRVESLAPDQPVWMGTFHRFCAKLLRRYAPMVGLSENYSIYDMADSKHAMKRAISIAEVSTTHASPEQIASVISRAKNRLVTPEMMQGHLGMSPQETLAARVYPVFQQLLLTSNAVDFDDLLLHIAVLLRQNPEIRSQLDSRFRYILVDEYQDTNLAQYAIVRALSINYPNLSVTGDPDQSIYGWRGADLNNILDFEKDYPYVKIVRLEKNYRSTPNILRVADDLIRHNRHRKPKELFTDNPEGEPVTLRMFNDGREEANAIADEIAQAVGSGQVRADEIAVFCRMNALTRAFEQAMRGRSLPYQVVNGVEFYQRKEIKDLLAYLHLINNPSHDVALQRIINTPTRGIGDKTLDQLRRYADQKKIPILEAARRATSIDSLSKRSTLMVSKFVSLYDRFAAKATECLEDILRYLVQEIQYGEYLSRTEVEQQDANPIANVDELIAGGIDFDRQHPEGGCLEMFLEQVALVADTDALDGGSGRVTLMTLHGAKGLEFPWVYVIGVEDDLLPHARSKNSEWEIEEERRLLFVGITRAEKRLQLSCCKRRAIRGDLRPVIPSPFLSELPLSEMRRVEATTESDWFDGDCIDAQYSDDQYTQDWEQQPPTSLSESASRFDVPIDDEPPAAPLQRVTLENSKPTFAALKTAKDLMNSGQVPIVAYREGVVVRHEDYGDGTILSVDGRGLKRIARIRFDTGEKSFRLAHTKLEVVE
jgi:DNA helicase II / ATP-dependent DNA helicase PcrA